MHHSAPTAWSSRLLAAAAALVLAVASAIGAYAHAAGHHTAHTDHHAVAAGAAVAVAGHGGEGTAAALPAPGCSDAHGVVNCSHGHDHPRHSLDCCDTVCHGGQAILTPTLVVPASLRSAPSMEPAVARCGAHTGGREQ